MPSRILGGEDYQTSEASYLHQDMYNTVEQTCRVAHLDDGHQSSDHGHHTDHRHRREDDGHHGSDLGRHSSFTHSVSIRIHTFESN